MAYISKEGKEMRAQIDATKNLPNLEFEFTHMEGSSKYKPECYSLDSWIQYWADILETKKPTSFFVLPARRLQTI